MTRRRVAVFTSSRADFGPLGPVIGALDAEPDAELVVIATGTHTAGAFGGRLGDIQISDRSILEVVDAELAGTEPEALAEAYGRIAVGVSNVFARRDVDLVVVLGDRWELLAVAGAALLHGVPIAHLHGGETTEGAIDERIRHGITKLADLHICSTTDSARRIRHLGEEPWRIVVTGAPGLDRIAGVEPLDPEELERLLGMTLIRPFGVVVYHPPTIDREDISGRARAVLDASAHVLGTVLALYPGADPGSGAVIAEIEGAVARNANVGAARNLGEDYLRVLKAADVLVGNSSSGIIEAASLHLPVIDVGDRQRGRVRPPNVLHVSDDEDEIGRAIVRAASPGFRASLAGLENPYGDGASARRVLRALLDTPLERLLVKPLVQLPKAGPSLQTLTIPRTSTLRDAIQAIDRGGCQVALVTDADGSLAGTIVDGDVRRALLAGATLEAPITGYVTVVPLVATEADGPSEVLALMQRASVTQVPIVDEEGRLVGLHAMRAVVNDVLDTALVFDGVPSPALAASRATERGQS